MKKIFTFLLLYATAVFASCSKDDPVAVADVRIDKPTMALTVGETGQLTVTVTPEDAADKSVVWRSGNTAAATVDDSGLVTAVAAGNATITATAGGKQATCEVTVTDAVPEGVTVTTYDALLEALQTGGTSADAPTLVTLGTDITVPAGGDYTTPPMNGSGHFKIDGGGHTMTWEDGNNCHFLGNADPDADPVYIELTNINLVGQEWNSSVGVLNGRITLGKDVTLNGQYESMIIAVGEKAALELGDGCELSYTAGTPCCVKVLSGATLVLNGGKTAAGAYINLSCTFYPAASHPLISVPKALTGDVHLLLNMTSATPVAQGIGSYQLTQADCGRLKVDPESTVSFSIQQAWKYSDDFELHLDPAADYQIKVRPKNFTTPTSGTIDMTNMTDIVAQATIRAALDAGYTDLKLMGELSKIGMGDVNGIFANNTQITTCDLTGVTGWGATPTLPDRAFKDCTNLQEVKLPDGVQEIGEFAFLRCNALTTVNLPQVTRIDNSAFRECTSLTTLALDNAAAIDQDAFYGCTGLETLKIPKCTRFGTYIVTGCRSLTRIEATAAGDFVDISYDNNSIENSAVFQNRNAHSGDNAFDPAKCALVLNPDKKQDGAAVPKVSNGNEWTVGEYSGGRMQWKSITFAQ